MILPSYNSCLYIDHLNNIYGRFNHIKLYETNVKRSMRLMHIKPKKEEMLFKKCDYSMLNINLKRKIVCQ